MPGVQTAIARRGLLHDPGRERVDQQGERLAGTGCGADSAASLLRTGELRQRHARRERSLRPRPRRRLSRRSASPIAGVPRAATCGDGQVNQPSEQCDGIDDDVCPGQCQPELHVRRVDLCGNDTRKARRAMRRHRRHRVSRARVRATAPAARSAVTAPSTAARSATAPARWRVRRPRARATAPAARTAATTSSIPARIATATARARARAAVKSDCTCAPICGDDQREAGELCDGTDDSLCPGKVQQRLHLSGPRRGDVQRSSRGADLDAGWSGVANNFQLPDRRRSSAASCRAATARAT